MRRRVPGSCGVSMDERAAVGPGLGRVAIGQGWDADFLG